MAAKKKSPQSSTAAEKRVTSKSKTQSSSKPSKAQVDALKGKTNTSKPTAAFTNPGQKATGLGKSTVKGNRFSSTAKTPVTKPGQGLRGSGTPLGTSIALSQPTKKSNLVNAALTVTALPGSGQFSKWAAGKVAGKVGGAVESATWSKAAKGLENISSGGKVGKTFTPMGPTLKSTRIMNPKQVSAAQNALLTRAENITGAATKAAVNASSRITKQIIQKATGGAKVAGVTGAVVNSKVNKKKKK